MVFGVHVTWPVSGLKEYERIKELAGPENLSKLVRNLLKEWLDKQEATIQNNPIGLRYETPDSKHWIDILTELDTKKVTEDIDLVENQQTLTKLKTVGNIIQRETDVRSMQLWKLERMVTKI